jgi:hypothetical protein
LGTVASLWVSMKMNSIIGASLSGQG